MKKCVLLAAMFFFATTSMNAWDIMPPKDVESNSDTSTLSHSQVLTSQYNSYGEQFSSQQKSNFNYPDYGGTNYIFYGMRYKELKHIYDFREWHGGYERYSPFWCGFASFFIPGLGQMCEGEGLRGLGQIGVNIGLGLLATGFANNGYAEAYLIIALTRLGYGIWSIIDATRIAKVKNMYETDLRAQHSEISVDMYPSLNPMVSHSGLSIAPGMTLSISF